MHELRVRRLLAIELGGRPAIDPTSVGPLGDHLIRVWIDVPTPRRVLIEVRRTGRPLARRALNIGALPGDVAAGFVAIAASEMVRVQATAVPRKPKPLPIANGESDRDMMDRLSGFALASGVTMAVLPGSEPATLLGTELALDHRRGITSQQLYGRWLTNTHGARLRWLEMGGAIGVHFPMEHDEIMWRLSAAARVGFVALQLPDTVAIDGVPSGPSTWSARSGALLAASARVARNTWITLGLEPGATLRSTAVTDALGETRNLGGFVLGGSLSLGYEPE